MNQYLLLLHDAPADFADVSPEEMQRIIEEYIAWRQSLVERDLYLGSNKLADEGGRIVMRDGDDVRVTDGPYAEAKEVIGGYFLISAADYEQAVEIARDCPHVRYGSRIEVRQVDRAGE